MVPFPRHYHHWLFDNPCFNRVAISRNRRGIPRERANTGQAREKAFSQSIFQDAHETRHNFIQKGNSEHAAFDCW